jgi:hypothetical protein
MVEVTGKPYHHNYIKRITTTGRDEFLNFLAPKTCPAIGALLYSMDYLRLTDRKTNRMSDFSPPALKPHSTSAFCYLRLHFDYIMLWQ